MRVSGSSLIVGWLCSVVGGGALLAQDVLQVEGPSPVSPRTVGCGKSAAARAAFDADALQAAEDGAQAREQYIEALTDTDVLSCNLDIEIVPGTKNISGSNTMVVKSLVNGLTTFTFRLRSNYTISQCQLNGATNVTPVAVGTYGRQITLDHAYNINQQFTLKITYSGTAVSTGMGSITFGTQGGSPIVSTLSEPYYAATWWPAKDGDSGQPGDNLDKFTMTMAVTAPNSISTIGNGVFLGYDVLSGNRRKYHWQTNYPISTYLVCFASTNYNTWQQTYTYPGGTMPVIFNIYPSSDTSGNRTAWEKCVQMLATYRPYYGEYPFINEKYGIYQFPFSGGMEHQTNTGEGVFIEGVTAHELGHQWWGDNVTCRYWNDIWLNEGFATFTEALWEQYKPGSTGWSAYFAKMQENKPTSVGDSVYCYSTTDENRIFSTTYTYQKGGWVLHMLRHVIGDTNFFNALANYRALYQQSAATTDNFAAAVSATVGTDLSYFFQQWVYGIGAPAYRFGWQSVVVNGNDYLKVYLAQTQTASYGKYKMPVDIRANFNPANTTFVANNDAVATQWFVFPLRAQALSVTFDPDGWLLYTAATEVAYVNGPPKIVQTAPQAGQAMAAGDGPFSVAIIFSEPVNAAAANFTVSDGTNNVPFTYSYDAANNKATLTFANQLGTGNYSVLVTAGVVSTAAGIALDGEIVDPNSLASLPSGNGQAGGNALFKFSVNVGCQGDLTGDAQIDLADLTIALGAYGTSGPGDLDASGQVDLADIAIMLGLYGTSCP